MTSNNLQPEGDWENQLNLIWERAHIPEWALDAKTAISRIFKESIAAERENITEEIESARIAGFNAGSDAPPEEVKLYIEKSIQAERTRCIKEIEWVGMVALYSEDYAQGFHAAIDIAIKIIRNEK